MVTSTVEADKFFASFSTPACEVKITRGIQILKYDLKKLIWAPHKLCGGSSTTEESPIGVTLFSYQYKFFSYKKSRVIMRVSDPVSNYATPILSKCSGLTVARKHPKGEKYEIFPGHVDGTLFYPGKDKCRAIFVGYCKNPAQDGGRGAVGRPGDMHRTRCHAAVAVRPRQQQLQASARPVNALFDCKSTKKAASMEGQAMEEAPRVVRCGLYMAAKKRPKFDAFVAEARTYGVEMLDLPLDEHAPTPVRVDVVLHKFTDDLANAGTHSEKYSRVMTSNHR
jgi:hypothetical protein